MHTNHNQLLRRGVAAMAVAVFGLSALASGITVKISRKPLNRALEEIEKVSDVRFFYESSLPQLSTEV